MKVRGFKSILTRLAFVLCCAVLLCACAEKSPEPPAATTAAAATVQTEQTAAEASSAAEETAAGIVDMDTYRPKYEHIHDLGSVTLPEEITSDMEYTPVGINPELYDERSTFSKLGLGVMLYKGPSSAYANALPDPIPYYAPVRIYACCIVEDEPVLRQFSDTDLESGKYKWLYCSYNGIFGWCGEFEIEHWGVFEPDLTDPVLNEQIVFPEKYYTYSAPEVSIQKIPYSDGVIGDTVCRRYLRDKDLSVRNRPDESAGTKRVLHTGARIWTLGTTKEGSAWTFIGYFGVTSEDLSQERRSGFMDFGWIDLTDEKMLMTEEEFRGEYPDETLIKW